MAPMSSPKFALVRPEPTEYAPYFDKYVSKVPGNDVVSLLESQRLQTAQLFAASTERDGNFRYAPESGGEGNRRTRHRLRTHFRVSSVVYRARGPNGTARL